MSFVFFLFPILIFMNFPLGVSHELITAQPKKRSLTLNASKDQGLDYSTKRILVIDDYVNMQHATRSMLNSIGTENTNITMVNSAADAVRKVKEVVQKTRAAFDIILCDYNL